MHWKVTFACEVHRKSALQSQIWRGALKCYVFRVALFSRHIGQTVRFYRILCRHRSRAQRRSPNVFFDTYNLFARHVGFNIFCNQRGNESWWNRCIVADLDILPVAVAVKWNFGTVGENNLILRHAAEILVDFTKLTLALKCLASIVWAACGSTLTLWEYVSRAAAAAEVPISTTKAMSNFLIIIFCFKSYWLNNWALGKFTAVWNKN